MRKVSEIVAELMELEQKDTPMYYFAMEILIEHLLENIKKIKKKEEKKKNDRKANK